MPKCTLMKHVYDPGDAHIAASAAISVSRIGIILNADDITRINSIITSFVRNGQSLHQIYLGHVDELMCSEKTLYNPQDIKTEFKVD